MSCFVLWFYLSCDIPMQVWTPPTPPQDDNDIYIDSVMMLMYDTTPMPESKLPPVYIRKEHKRLKMDPSGERSVVVSPKNILPHLILLSELILSLWTIRVGILAWTVSLFSPYSFACPAAARKKKKGHGETVIPPRSLFEKASMLKVRREGKDQKKNFSLKQQAPFAKPLPSLVKPAMEAGQDNPEWLISEDWALLQVLALLRSSFVPNRCGGRLRFRSLIPALCLTGGKAAAGVTSQPHNRVSSPHAQLGSGQRRGQLLQPHLPLTQTVPQPLRERHHPQRRGEGNGRPFCFAFSLIDSLHLSQTFFFFLFFFQLVYEANPKKKTKSIYKVS